MAKHWKTYLPKSEEDALEKDNIPKSLEEVAGWNSSIKELLEEKKQLEEKLKGLTQGSNDNQQSIQLGEVLSVDQKRKLEAKWEANRKKRKENAGLSLPKKKTKKTKWERKLTKKIKDDWFQNKLPEVNKKAKKNEKSGEDLFSISGKEKSLSKVNQFVTSSEEKFNQVKKANSNLKNELTEFRKRAKQDGLDLESLDKTIELMEKVDTKLLELDQKRNKVKEKTEPLRKFKNKVDSFMANDFEKEKKEVPKEKSENKKEGFSVSIGDIKSAVKTAKAVKKIKDDFMKDRDKKRTTKKKSNGFSV